MAAARSAPGALQVPRRQQRVCVVLTMMDQSRRVGQNVSVAWFGASTEKALDANHVDRCRYLPFRVLSRLQAVYQLLRSASLGLATTSIDLVPPSCDPSFCSQIHTKGSAEVSVSVLDESGAAWVWEKGAKPAGSPVTAAGPTELGKQRDGGNTETTPGETMRDEERGVVEYQARRGAGARTANGEVINREASPKLVNGAMAMDSDRGRERDRGAWRVAQRSSARLVRRRCGQRKLGQALA
ncbi:hypothetical protein BKA81DRAFT_375805 [Phyllosticta paracitricarpa]|uniref:Uncharacterized protein n=1 Tax=Phyllosticta citricarpa TaxID=55181 RepID=A0ABR1MIL2_9PEZI